MIIGQWEPVDRKVRSDRFDELTEERVGIMLHIYEDEPSTLISKKSNLSYNVLVLQDGSYSWLVNPSKRAWHAGNCKPSNPQLDYEDANSAFYGIALYVPNGAATPMQLITGAWMVGNLLVHHGWPIDQDHWRLAYHSEEAWPRGRRSDPEPFWTRRMITSLLPLFLVEVSR